MSNPYKVIQEEVEYIQWGLTHLIVGQYRLRRYGDKELADSHYKLERLVYGFLGQALRRWPINLSLKYEGSECLRIRSHKKTQSYLDELAAEYSEPLHEQSSTRYAITNAEFLVGMVLLGDGLSAEDEFEEVKERNRERVTAARDRVLNEFPPLIEKLEIDALQKHNLMTAIKHEDFPRLADLLIEITEDWEPEF